MATVDPTISTPVEYREIPGYPGYRSGDDGSIWSCRKGGSASHILKTTWRRLKPAVCRRDGRPKLVLRRDGQYHSFTVHRLVLEAFVGPCPPGMECCHNDGNPANNAISNLRWDTHKANEADKIRHGTEGSKLTADQVRAIRSDHEHGVSRNDLAEIYHVTPEMIGYIVRRQSWTHVE